MTAEWRLALGASLGLHAAALFGAPAAVERPAFDVERAPTSVELYLAREPRPTASATPQPVAAVVEPPAPVSPLEAQAPQTVVTPEAKGAEVEVLPGYLRNPPPVYPRSARERASSNSRLSRSLISSMRAWFAVWSSFFCRSRSSMMLRAASWLLSSSR